MFASAVEITQRLRKLPLSPTDADGGHLINQARFILQKAEQKRFQITPLIEFYLTQFVDQCATMPVGTWPLHERTEPVLSRLIELDMSEGERLAPSFKKLNAMQLHWFNLRFGEYLKPDGHTKELEQTNRASGIPKRPQTTTAAAQESTPSTAVDDSQKVFLAGSWAQIYQLLQREEAEVSEVPARHRRGDASMTLLLQTLAYHNLDNFHNINLVISDYVTRSAREHIKNHMTVEELAYRGDYYHLAGRLAADLAMLDRLPPVLKGWVLRVFSRILEYIHRYFSVFNWHAPTGMLRHYTVREDHRSEGPGTGTGTRQGNETSPRTWPNIWSYDISSRADVEGGLAEITKLVPGTIIQSLDEKEPSLIPLPLSPVASPATVIHNPIGNETQTGACSSSYPRSRRAREGDAA